MYETKFSFTQSNRQINKETEILVAEDDGGVA